MFESWSAHFNEIKEAVERFEKMEYSGQEYFFDVHSIENIFDFYIDKLQFNKAERIIKLGIRQHPGASTLKIKEAILYIEKGQLSKAIILLENLLRIEKSNPEVYLNLGYAYLRDGLNEKALQTFENGLKFAFSDEEEVLLDVVLYLNQFYEYEATIKILSERYSEISDDENLLFELAYALDKVGENQKAYNIYEELLNINPYSENAWYNAGISLVKLERLKEANNAFDFCLAISPDHAQAHFNKGNSLAQQNRYLEALESYLECISYEIRQAKCLHYIADCWNHLGNSSRAVQFFKMAVNTDFMDFDAWEGFARFYLEQHEPQACREVINQALAEKELMTDEELGTFYHLMGQSYVLDEEWELSKKFFKKAALSNRKDFRHLVALYKLNLALNPEYNIEIFVDQYIPEFIETGSFQYMLAAYHLLITENFDNGIYHLEEASVYAPGFMEEFTDTFPEIIAIAKNNKKLTSLIELNNGNYEF
jgi:tetratricopeptide (TPR) repeat protein